MDCRNGQGVGKIFSDDHIDFKLKGYILNSWTGTWIILNCVNLIDGVPETEKLVKKINKFKKKKCVFACQYDVLTWIYMYTDDMKFVLLTTLNFNFTLEK